MGNRLAVIGFPVGHSLSPAIQGAAIRSLGLDIGYEARAVDPADLAAFMAELRRPEWLGVNVTVPHKQAVMPHLSDLSPEAQAIGAVNTIVNQRGRLTGHNTDAPGFLADLQERFGPVGGKRVAVLGAGGAAYAVCHALRPVAGQLWILNRTEDRAKLLAERIGARVAMPDRLKACDLIVNCTSAGLRAGDSPLPDEAVPEGIDLYDLIYNPPVTRLMDAVRRGGGRAVNGLGMLVHQAAISLQIWTGRQAPLDVMFRAAEEAIAAHA